MTAPCMRCTEDDRFIGCHSICKIYIEFQQANEKTRLNRQDYYNKNGIVVESIRRNNKRNHNPHRYGAQGAKNG